MCKTGDRPGVGQLEQQCHLCPAYCVALGKCLSLSVPQVGVTDNLTWAEEEEIVAMLAKCLAIHLTLRKPHFIFGPNSNSMTVSLPVP